MSDMTVNWSDPPMDLMLAPQGKAEPPITSAKIRQLWEQGSRMVRPEQRQYWINRSFLRGEQWIYWDRVRDRINELPRDERVRAVVNQMWPASRTIASKALQRPLVFEVPPCGADDASVIGARIAEACLEHTAREQNWEDHREKEWWAMWLGGTAVVSVDWDPRAGTMLGYDPIKGKKFGTGDVVLQVCSIAECATEPGVRDIEKGRWWIKVTTLPPKQAQDQYQLKAEPAADANMALSPFQTKVLNSDGREVAIPLTLVLTYYERPSSLRPDGVVAVVVGNEVVDQAPWPFPFKDKLNCVAFRETKVQDRWNGDTVFTAGTPVQTAYNASWSAIIEHMKLAGNARLMVPDVSLDLIDELTDSPGEVIPYNSTGGAPGYLAPPQMPQWWIEQPQQLEAALADILGNHEVSQGDTPPNIESGLGISILAEQDNTPIGHMVKEQAAGWGRIATLVLELCEVKVKETRTARVPGPSAAPMVMSWTGKSFRGQTRAVVPVDALLPRSKAAAQAWATQLWDRKIIDNPRTFAKVADLPGREDFTQSLDPDLAKAQRENHDMTCAMVRIPDEFDNHATHIDAHNTFRKAEQYEQLDPQLRAVIDLHVKAHETMAAESAALQLGKQLAHPALGEAPNANQTPMATVVPGGAPATTIGAPVDPNAASGPPGANPAPPDDQPTTGPGQGAETLQGAMA